MRHLFFRTGIPAFERHFVLAHMSRPPFHRIRLECYPKGIDGVHVDVALDTALVDAVVDLVKSILRTDVEHYFWHQAPKVPDVEVAGRFQKVYMDHNRMVLRRVRSAARPETAQLFQLAIMRLLLLVVDQQFCLMQQELHDARALPARQHSGKSLELHEKIIALARNEDSIRFRTLHNVLRIVVRLEDSGLRKLRKAVLGISWPVPRSMLVNPILQLGGQGSGEDFFQFYPHVLRNDAAAMSLSSSLFEVLSEWLPDELVLPSETSGNTVNILDRSGKGLRGQIQLEHHVSHLIGQSELAQMIPHEFDNNENVMALLGGDSEHWPDPGAWRRKGFERVQRAKVKEWVSMAEKAGLMNAIRGSYRLASIYPVIGIRGGAEWVYEYLTGNCSSRDLARRLQTLPGVSDSRAVVRAIEERLQSREDIGGRNLDERTAVRFIGDMVRYRYDLKLATWMYAGMNQLRLLHDEKKLAMSASNGLLQDFRHAQPKGERKVIGHVVIKADVRGSTRITAEMRERNLNPATYFSRHLYDPINRELEALGAEKVFVEGDAVILSLMEYQGHEVDQFAVARACGLAQRILQVIEAKNATCREFGLPQLGLGIGIAYVHEAPTYLYDEGRKIMISPAINRADRLSSCHAGLRRAMAGMDGSRPRVVVAVPVQNGNSEEKSDQEGLLHYNVNGIELEAAAFYQLEEELKLSQVRLDQYPDKPAETYHMGHYLDLRGKRHWLVIRESPVLLWIGDRLVRGDRYNHVYYEVVSDPALISKVMEAQANTSS